MAFAYLPEGGLPRLLRFDLTEDHVIARWDEANNLLRINKTLFDQLDYFQQREVEKTQSKEIIADYNFGKTSH